MEKEYKLNVILDLDNTIVNALSIEDRRKLPAEFAKNFKFQDYIPFFRIYARPHLEEFLDYLFKNYNVAVLTAAEKDYALFIVERFILTKPNRHLEFIMFRTQVDMAEELFGGMKDLRVIWETFKVNNFYPSNTIIIDDLDLVAQTNPNNTLRIEAFFIVDEETGEVNLDSDKDKELLNMMVEIDFLKEHFNTQVNKWVDRSIMDFSEKNKNKKTVGGDVEVDKSKSYSPSQKSSE